MKKLALLFLMAFQFGQAQDSLHVGDRLKTHLNEVRFNIVPVITSSRVNLAYERFLNRRFSMGLYGSYADSKNANNDFDLGFTQNRPVYEVIPYFRVNLSKSIVRYYFIEVFGNVNGGDYRETVKVLDPAFNAYYEIQKSTYVDLALGASLGYKMYFNQKVAVQALVGAGFNTLNTDKSADIISRVGLSVGYRF